MSISIQYFTRKTSYYDHTIMNVKGSGNKGIGLSFCGICIGWISVVVTKRPSWLTAIFDSK